MCGFVGFMDKLNQDEKRKSIKLMADRIIHRGPDEEGYFVEDASVYADILGKRYESKSNAYGEFSITDIPKPKMRKI